MPVGVRNCLSSISLNVLGVFVIRFSNFFERWGKREKRMEGWGPKPHDRGCGFAAAWGLDIGILPTSDVVAWSELEIGGREFLRFSTWNNVQGVQRPVRRIDCAKSCFVLTRKSRSIIYSPSSSVYQLWMLLPTQVCFPIVVPRHREALLSAIALAAACHAALPRGRASLSCCAPHFSRLQPLFGRPQQYSPGDFAEIRYAWPQQLASRLFSPWYTVSYNFSSANTEPNPLFPLKKVWNKNCFQVHRACGNSDYAGILRKMARNLNAMSLRIWVPVHISPDQLIDQLLFFSLAASEVHDVEEPAWIYVSDSLERAGDHWYHFFFVVYQRSQRSGHCVICGRSWRERHYGGGSAGWEGKPRWPLGLPQS